MKFYSNNDIIMVRDRCFLTKSQNITIKQFFYMYNDRSSCYSNGGLEYRLIINNNYCLNSVILHPIAKVVDPLNEELTRSMLMSTII